jgi:D-3-phosphoglycerate dehydrogenase
MKILANDGISKAGVEKLEQAGFEVSTQHIEQEALIDHINSKGITALLVRSATKVRKELIDACPTIKLIGRGGVGMDNIDVEYARNKGMHVINTPAASSQSVAELVMGQLFALSRGVHDANREMPVQGNSAFKALKKKYAKGQELRGKTLGIVGFGRIGQSLATYALGAGMRVKAVDFSTNPVEITVPIGDEMKTKVVIKPVADLSDIIQELDYISIHVPKQANGEAVIIDETIQKMKDGVIIVNAARGGVIDEDAILKNLNIGKIRAIALDVFENEPTPRKDLLVHEKIAATPHIGAATLEAQTRIGIELAEQIIKHLK